MKLYLVSFSIDLTENLINSYEKVLDKILTYKSVVFFNKTTALVKSEVDESVIRSTIEKTIEDNNNTGSVFVVEITSSNWSFSTENNVKFFDWLNKNAK